MEEAIVKEVENTEELANKVDVEERGKIISDEDVQSLDSHVKGIESFLKDNSDVTEWSSEKKDEMYKDVTGKWTTFQESLKKIEYNYYATTREYKWFRNLIMNETSYGVNDIFVAMRVKEVFKEGDKVFLNSGKKVEKGVFKVKIDELTLAYHLMENYKHKGLGETAYLFANTLKSIGDISIVYNRYDKISKQLSEAIGNWCGGLDPAPVPTEQPQTEVIQA